jgi:uncharacterized protein (DUF433 family)
LGYATGTCFGGIVAMAKFDRVTCNPAIVNGQPTIRGMRLTVRRVIEGFE